MVYCKPLPVSIPATENTLYGHGNIFFLAVYDLLLEGNLFLTMQKHFSFRQFLLHEARYSYEGNTRLQPPVTARECRHPTTYQAGVVGGALPAAPSYSV